MAVAEENRSRGFVIRGSTIDNRCKNHAPPKLITQVTEAAIECFAPEVPGYDMARRYGPDSYADYVHRKIVEYHVQNMIAEIGVMRLAHQVHNKQRYAGGNWITYYNGDPHKRP